MQPDKKDTQFASRIGFTTVATVIIFLAVIGSSIGVAAAATEFSFTTTAPDTVSPGDSINVTYTIDNAGDTDLASLGFEITSQTPGVTITEIRSPDAVTITEDNNVLFETVSPEAAVTTSLTITVASNATGSQSLRAQATNGFGDAELSKNTTTTLTISEQSDGQTNESADGTEDDGSSNGSDDDSDDGNSGGDNGATGGDDDSDSEGSGGDTDGGSSGGDGFGPGFGVGGALAGLGGAGYLLKRRRTNDETDSS
jgi:PGF-CTERM protein